MKFYQVKEKAVKYKSELEYKIIPQNFIKPAKRGLATKPHGPNKEDKNQYSGIQDSVAH